MVHTASYHSGVAISGHAIKCRLHSSSMPVTKDGQEQALTKLAGKVRLSNNPAGLLHNVPVKAQALGNSQGLRLSRGAPHEPICGHQRCAIKLHAGILESLVDCLQAQIIKSIR